MFVSDEAYCYNIVFVCFYVLKNWRQKKIRLCSYGRFECKAKSQKDHERKNRKQKQTKRILLESLSTWFLKRASFLNISINCILKRSSKTDEKR